MATFAGNSYADEARVVGGDAEFRSSGWVISATVRHPDTGWEHYTDEWQVLAPDRSVLGTRELLHPHVNEQPFTRSLRGVIVPDGVPFIIIKARDNLAGYGDQEYRLELTR